MVRFADGDVHLALSSTVDLDVDDCSASARLALRAGGSALFVLEVLAPGEPATACGEGDVDELFEATASFWRAWPGCRRARTRVAGASGWTGRR